MGKSRTGPLIALAGLFVLSLWAGSWFIITRVYAEPSARSAFGDMFGAVNALFAGLAFAGLVIAIYFQTQELGLQRLELAETRKELKGQKEQLLAQNETLKQQRFENTFFQLVRLHHDIIGSMTVGTRSGRKIFPDLFDEFRRKFFVGFEQDENQTYLTQIEHVYSDLFYPGREAQLGHYFRNLYNLVKFVDRSSLDNRSKRFYTNLIRAQLSRYELLLLFYDCLSRHGVSFKPLVERYDLLQHLRREDLVISVHIGLYESLRSLPAEPVAQDEEDISNKT